MMRFSVLIACILSATNLFGDMNDLNEWLTLSFEKEYYSRQKNLESIQILESKLDKSIKLLESEELIKLNRALFKELCDKEVGHSDYYLIRSIHSKGKRYRKSITLSLSGNVYINLSNMDGGEIFKKPVVIKGSIKGVKIFILKPGKRSKF